MASRPVWKGFIRFSLVSVPVRAYTAAVGETGKIKFNQLHKGCNQRVKYQKVCPVHGELRSDEIVSGYQFAEDQYVIVDESELEKLRTPRDQAIDIQAFIAPDAIDPRFLTDRHHYLTPDGPIAQKPYTLLLRAMAEQKRYAFARIVLNNREQLVQVRPVGKLLVMDVVSYVSQVKPLEEFLQEVVPADVPRAELDLAKSLTDALAVKDFKLDQFRDLYQERLQKLVEAKVEGKQVVAAPQEEAAPQVINLMEALQKSVEQARQAGAGLGAGAGKPPPLQAEGTAGKAKAARKRKSS